MAMRHQPKDEQSASKYHTRISEDRLAVIVDCTIPEGNLEHEIQRVRNEMVEYGVVDEGSLNTASACLTKAAEASSKIEGLSLLEGTPPKPPTDGYVEWAGEFYKKGFVVDPETDAVDYREKAADLSVAEGRLLATLYPPVEGESGIDVFGKTIEPRKPTTVRMKAGKNVRLEEAETNTYFATKDGRIRFVAGVIAVDDVYEIKGSVGLRSGNVNHPGALIVSENIDAESKVSTEGDITVRGYVEDGDIECGGSLTVTGGITGSLGCNIRAAGDVSASYANNAEITAEGDVIIKREITQCKVRTQGTVVTPGGHIVGGEVEAFEGIEVGQVGTSAGVRTILTVGKDHKVEGRIKEKQEELAKSKEMLKKIGDAVAPMKRRLESLQGKAKERVVLLLKQAKEIEKKTVEIQAELDAIFKESEERRHKIILVRNQIGPDTVFNIGPLTMQVKDLVKGSIKVEIKDGKIRLFKLRR